MKEERGEKTQKKIERKVVGWLCVVLVLASISGGVVLGWWVIQFQASNKQQWMVPFSLVLMVTPILILISVFISDSSMNMNSSSVSSLDHHHSPEIR